MQSESQLEYRGVGNGAKLRVIDASPEGSRANRWFWAAVVVICGAIVAPFVVAIIAELSA